LIFIFVASIFFGKPIDAIRTCMLDHNKTASPNSGWSMAAVSGALNVRLEKLGYHVMGNNYSDPKSFDIKKATYLVGFSSFLVIAGIYLSGKIPLM
jgi:adenosylcobinamide-phosphate synthase